MNQPRAGDVAVEIFAAAAAARRRQVPARINDDEIRLAQMVSEPLRGDK
jgi:hypothetical protein